MSKINKKDLEKFIKVSNTDNTLTIPYNFVESDTQYEIEVNVRNYMTIDEKSTFIQRVISNCFDENGNYIPEYRDPMFQITILQMLTDVPVFERTIKLLDSNGNETDETRKVIDIEKTYTLCKALNLGSKVSNNKFINLYAELYSLVETRLNFEIQRTLMGEKQALAKAREEIETGVALVSSIGEQLSDTLFKAEENKDILMATAEATERFKNMSDADIVDVLLKNSK